MTYVTTHFQSHKLYGLKLCKLPTGNYVERSGGLSYKILFHNLYERKWEMLSFWIVGYRVTKPGHLEYETRMLVTQPDSKKKIIIIIISIPSAMKVSGI